MFILLNYMFCILYCGEVSTTSWRFSIFWALLFCGILTLMPTIARRIGMVVLVVLYALTSILHAVMYNLFGNFFAFSDLLYTEDGLAFFSFTYIKARKLLWLTAIGCILLSVFLAWNLKQKKYAIRQIILGVIFLVVGVVGIRSQHTIIMSGVNTVLSWHTAGQVENEADVYQSMSNKNYVMSMTGIYQYMYRSFMLTTGLEDQLNNGEMYAELDDYFAKRAENAHAINDMSGVYEGKNVLFIMLESIDTWMLTEEYMPNLYKVQQDSMNFVNHFSPLYISAGTFNTEFIANTGLIPPSSGVDTKVYKENYFPMSLANSFSDAGYYSNSFHSSSPSIYNRGAIHENLGYKKYHSYADMGMENYMLDSQLINGYSLMVAEEPFFSFIITYSGHGPYTEELKDISDGHLEEARLKVAENSVEASKEDLDEYTYAIAHAMETDEFIGNLMTKLESNELLEDTVLVFFSDHFGKYMTNHEFVMDLKGVENKDFLCNTPYFIYHKGAEAKQIETISSTTDIAPTIANLFGLDVLYEYYLGVDVFSEEEHYVVFPGNSWYDGAIYYTLNYDGKITEEITRTNKDISQKMKFSEYILKSDYFSYLRGESKVR